MTKTNIDYKAKYRKLQLLFRDTEKEKQALADQIKKLDRIRDLGKEIHIKLDKQKPLILSFEDKFRKGVLIDFCSKCKEFSILCMTVNNKHLCDKCSNEHFKTNETFQMKLDHMLELGFKLNFCNNRKINILEYKKYAWSMEDIQKSTIKEIDEYFATYNE
jgi:hypothetical protein